MVKIDIKNFELKTEIGSFACAVPCSVNSVFTSAGQNPRGIGSTVRFETTVNADDVALSIKNFYLRIRGVRRPAEVYLGDKKICECDGITPLYNVNLSGVIGNGENLLSVRFHGNDEELLYAGISESFEILRFGGAIIDSLSLNQNHSDGVVTLGIKLDIIGDSSVVRAVATLVSPTGQIYYAGLTGGKGSVIVKDPLYWWPNRLGVQNIYRLTVNLYGETDIEDSLEMTVGLRSVEAADGSAIKINGREMIPMGAVYLSEADPDFTMSDKRAEKQVSAAAMAGYNCLVIPLSSPTPSEKFYKLCDTYGIAVIEEHEVVDEGVAASLRARLHHPSLCLVDLISGENTAMYEEKMKESLEGLAFATLPSAHKYISLPALPSMKSIRAVVPEGERNLFSRYIEDMAEEGAIKDMLMSVADRYPYPRDLSGFAYASALASAHKVGEVVKNSRLSGGKTGRSIFNRLCDTSLVISSSAIDYRGRWKPLQYYCSRLFAPLTVYAEANEGVVNFSVSNLSRNNLFGTLEYRVADGTNYTVFKGSEPVEINAFTEGVIHTADLSEIILGHESEYYLEYYLKDGSSAVSRKTHLFRPEKHFDFKKPTINTTITGQDRKFSVVISATNFVKDLEIGFDGIDAVFSDNYLDITSEAPIKVDFTVSGAGETIRHLEDALELRSVWDLK